MHTPASLKPPIHEVETLVKFVNKYSAVLDGGRYFSVSWGFSFYPPSFVLQLLEIG